ncbi:MAG: FeoB-associated Cys-rich membrane protein [Gemmataceae bacterium]
MSPQLIITLSIIALAAAFLGWRLLRFSSALKKGHCGGGCGCGTTTKKRTGALIAPEELTLRRRD